jgi:hypothetical protein
VSGLIKTNERLAVLLDLDRILELDEVMEAAMAVN